jgi:hypothetical protein
MDFFLLEGMYEVVVVFYCTNLSSEVYIFFGFIIFVSLSLAFFVLIGTFYAGSGAKRDESFCSW